MGVEVWGDGLKFVLNYELNEQLGKSETVLEKPPPFLYSTERSISE